MRRFPLDLRLLLILSFSVSILVTPADAQPLCFGPDNLQGPCCTVTTISLPSPLPVPPPLLASGICWTDCQPQDSPTELTFGAFVEVSCGSYVCPMFVKDILGQMIMRGELHLDYSRTWTEQNFDGDDLQCWRFLAKIDLYAITGQGTGPCQVPAGDEPQAFYYGYYDLVLNCRTGGYEHAICLFHSCDAFVHNPKTSTVPGVFHPQVSYALVAPVSLANPFVPTPLPPFFGPMTGGGFRYASGGLLPWKCPTEEPLWVDNPLGHTATLLLGQDCVCSDNTSQPLQYSYLYFTALGQCGMSFNSIDTSNAYPWKHLVTASLGTWTGTGAGTPYPGPEAAWVTEGAFKSKTGPCGRLTVMRGEGAYGALTEGGFPVFPDADRPGQTDRMLDLATNFSKIFSILGGPYNGSVNKTNRLIYANF